VAVGHAIWAVGDTDVLAGTVRAIDNDGHCTIAVDGGGGTMASVCRQNVCLKWQVGADMRVPDKAASGDAGSFLRALAGGPRQWRRERL